MRHKNHCLHLKESLFLNSVFRYAQFHLIESTTQYGISNGTSLETVCSKSRHYFQNERFHKHRLEDKK
jgi:retron-type reverse transcriptase